MNCRFAALAAFMLLGLAACGREEPGASRPAGPTKEAAKGDAKKAGATDEAPRVVDPMKEGY